MHWLGYNDAISWLNEAKTQIFQPTANFEIFKIYLYFVCQSASLPACLVALGIGLQKFHMIKVMAADLRKCCSEDDLPTAPWRFLLSFFLLPCSSLFLQQGVNLTFEGDDSLLRLLLITSITVARCFAVFTCTLITS